MQGNCPDKPVFIAWLKPLMTEGHLLRSLLWKLCRFLVPGDLLPDWRRCGCSWYIIIISSSSLFIQDYIHSTHIRLSLASSCHKCLSKWSQLSRGGSRRCLLVELVLDPVVGCVVVLQKTAVVVLASSRCWFLTHGTGRWRVGRNRPLLDFTVKSKALVITWFAIAAWFSNPPFGEQAKLCQLWRNRGSKTYF